MHVALISCDHGMGHVRRTRLIAAEFAARGCRVTVLAPADKWNRFDSGGHEVGVQLVDFHTFTSPQSLRGNRRSSTHWEARLPDMDHFDVVMSDTLPEILARRPDAILIAQFFWHDVISGVNPTYLDRNTVLLATHQPTVIGSTMFAMPEVASQPGFHGVGLFHHAPNQAALAGVGVNRRATDLLLTGGSTPQARATFSTVVSVLAAEPALPFETIWLDPQLWAPTMDPLFKPATFDEAMFANLEWSICRPGLGIVTELLARRVPMLLAYESGNREMAHNAKVLVRSGNAYDTSGDVTHLVRQLHQHPRPSQQPSLDFNAAASVAELVLGSD